MLYYNLILTLQFCIWYKLLYTNNILACDLFSQWGQESIFCYVCNCFDIFLFIKKCKSKEIYGKDKEILNQIDSLLIITLNRNFPFFFFLLRIELDIFIYCRKFLFYLFLYPGANFQNFSNLSANFIKKIFYGFMWGGCWKVLTQPRRVSQKIWGLLDCGKWVGSRTFQYLVNVKSNELFTDLKRIASTLIGYR